MRDFIRATIADCELINELASQVWEPTYGEILSPDQLTYMFDRMYSIESLQRQMNEEGQVFFIAYEEGLPCGYVSIERQGDALFHIQKIYVLPRTQGNGFGRFMIDNAFDYIKKLQPEKCIVELNVNRYNKALDFYKRIGFQVKEEGDFPIGNGYYMNDYIMQIEI